MNFPRHWAKATRDGVTCWRWSNESLAQASHLAGQAVQELAERVRASGWPWEDEKTQRRFEDWERRYAEASRGRATCALVRTIGDRRIHPAAAPVLSLHDEATGVGRSLPLA